MINAKGIIILSAFILILVTVLVFVNGMDSLTNIIGFENLEDNPVVFEIDSEEIREITINMPKENFTLFKDSNDIWKCKNADFIVDTEKIETLVSSLSYVYAYELIEKNSQKLSDYGLDDPEYTITAVTEDKSVTFYRGKETPVGNYYYFKTSDSDDVYSQYSEKCKIFFKESMYYQKDIG